MTIKITNKLNKNNLLDLSGSRLGIKILGTICFSTMLIGSSYWSYEKQNTRNTNNTNNTNNTKFLKITESNILILSDILKDTEFNISQNKTYQTFCLSIEDYNIELYTHSLINGARKVVKEISLPEDKANEIKENKKLTHFQQKNIIKAYHIGNTVKAKDGTSFGITLAGIMAQESSYGTKLYNTEKFDKIKTSVGAFQMHIPTARFIIKEYELVKYEDLNDTDLAYKLAHDFEFSAVLAALYLKRNYEVALEFHKNPWRATVSRYNGGWYNNEYLNLITKKIETIQEIIKTYKI